jgi:hypothetical protein
VTAAQEMAMMSRQIVIHFRAGHAGKRKLAILNLMAKMPS